MPSDDIEPANADATRESRRLAARLADLVPGGAHTYAKGEDQYPEGLAPIIARGRGSHVWDVDGNEYVEYGSGLRAVVARPRPPARRRGGPRGPRPGRQLRPPDRRSRSRRPSGSSRPIGWDMVKFARNGSDVTTAAVKLARAATGRDLVAICEDQPFFSTDDWFIGHTPMPAGIPQAMRDLTVGFRYNDLESVRRLFAEHPGQVACLVLEPATADEPAPGFLEGLRELCTADGALLVFDEMITGLPLATRRAPSACTACARTSRRSARRWATGSPIAALAGPRELMELGGIRDQRERVFLLSTTHGAETHGAGRDARGARDVRREEGSSTASTTAGGASRPASARPRSGRRGLDDRVLVMGRPCNLVFATLDADGQRRSRSGRCSCRS